MLVDDVRSWRFFSLLTGVETRRNFIACEVSNYMVVMSCILAGYVAYVGIFVWTGWVCYPVLGEDGCCFITLCWFFPVNFRGDGEWLDVGCSANFITANWSVDHTRSPLRFTVTQGTKQLMQWILKQTLKQRCCHKRQEYYINSVFNFSIIGRRQALLPWYCI